MGSKKKLGLTVVGLLAVLVVAAVFFVGPELTSSKEPTTTAVSPSQTPRITSTPTPQATPAVSPASTISLVLDAAAQNKLYSARRLPVVKCTLPQSRLATKDAVMQYGRAMVACLDKAWEPLVEQTGHGLQSPPVVVFSPKMDTSCSLRSEENEAFYCPSEGAIYLGWESVVADYRDDSLYGRMQLMNTIAHEYGHHVQNLVDILTSSNSRMNRATNRQAELLEVRRQELQASCFGAVYLGSNRSALGLSGEALTEWTRQAKNTGDENDPGGERLHGSKKSYWAWVGRGFASGDPKVCNTFIAPTAMLS